MALFLLLSEGGWQFRALHVDHGWREESSEEAQKLALFAQERGVFFHLEKMEKDSGGNLECKAREARYALFSKIYQKHSLDGLLLAHHSDDLVETILKRTFEGSGLSTLSFQESSLYEGMHSIRPFITTTKEEIRAYLKEKKMWYIEDRTNSDPQFLRSRMRSSLLPFLEESFGKGVKENILYLGKRGEKISHFLEERINEIYKGIKRGPFGLFLVIPSLHEVELEHLIRKIFKELKIVPLRSEIDRLIVLIKEGKGRKGVDKKDWKIFFDKERLFFLKRQEWEIGVGEGSAFSGGWEELWKGEIGVEIPCKTITLGPPELNAHLPNGWRLKEWYRVHHVPSFLRSWFPVLWQGKDLVGELLVPKEKGKRGNQVLTLKEKQLKYECDL